MKSVKVILFIVGFVATGIHGHQTNLKGEHLVAQSQRKIEEYIENFSTQLANFKTNYLLQLSALGAHIEMIQEKLEGTALHLDTLSLLEGAFHVCVEQHRLNIPVFESIKTRISDCATSALQNLNLYLEPADQQLENLKNYLKSQLKTKLNVCDDDNSEEGRYGCVVRTIRDSNVVTIRIRKDFTRALHAAEFESEHRIKEALDCGFNRLYEAILKVGETQTSLRQCIDKSEEEPTPCPIVAHEQQQQIHRDPIDIIYTNSLRVPPALNSSTGLCKNVLNLSNKQLKVRNSTIQIPANGLQSNVSCIRINFMEDHKTPSSSIA